MGEPSRLLQEALALSPAERARLAATLISSLDPEEDSHVEDAWRAEVARRVEELDKGLAKAVDWDEARKQILS